MFTVPLIVLADLSEDLANARTLLARLIELPAEMKIIQSGQLEMILRPQQSLLIVAYGGAKAKSLVQKIDEQNLSSIKVAIIAPQNELPQLRTLNRDTVLSLLDATLPEQALAARLKRLHSRILESVEQGQQPENAAAPEVQVTPSVFSVKSGTQRPLAGRRLGSIRRDISSLLAAPTTTQSTIDSEQTANANIMASSLKEPRNTSTLPPHSSSASLPLDNDSAAKKSELSPNDIVARLENRSLPKSISRVLLLEQEESEAGGQLIESLRFIGLQVEVVSGQTAHTNWALLEKFRPHLLLCRELFLKDNIKVWLQLFAAESRLSKTALVLLSSAVDPEKMESLALHACLLKEIPPVREPEAAVSESPRQRSTQSFHEQLDPLQALEKIDDQSQPSIRVDAAHDSNLAPITTELGASTEHALSQDLAIAEKDINFPKTQGQKSRADKDDGAAPDAQESNIAIGDTFSALTKKLDSQTPEKLDFDASFMPQFMPRSGVALSAALSLVALLSFLYLQNFEKTPTKNGHLAARASQDFSPKIHPAIAEIKSEPKKLPPTSEMKMQGGSAPKTPEVMAQAPAVIEAPPQREQNFFFTPESTFPDCLSFGENNGLTLKQRQDSSAAWAKSRQQLIRGDLLKAQSLMCEAVTLNPRSYALEGLAQVYLRAEAPSLALKWLQKGLKLRAQDKDSQQLLSDIYSRLGQPEKALSQLLALLEVPATDMRARRYLSKNYEDKATQFFKRGDLHRAEVWYRRAIILDEKSAKASASLSLLYAKKRLPIFATHWAHYALNIDQKSAEAHLALFDVALAQGSWAEAEAHLNQTISIDPTHRLLRRASRELEKRRAAH